MEVSVGVIVGITNDVEVAYGAGVFAGVVNFKISIEQFKKVGTVCHADITPSRSRRECLLLLQTLRARAFPKWS